MVESPDSNKAADPSLGFFHRESHSLATHTAIQWPKQGILFERLGFRLRVWKNLLPPGLPAPQRKDTIRLNPQ